LLSDEQATEQKAAGRYTRADAVQKTYATDVRKRTNSKELCRFAYQLAMLLRAGLPLAQGLSALIEQLQATSPPSRFYRNQNTLAQVIEQVRDRVNAGSTFAEALSRHPDVFSNFFINMVAAGEASGALDEILLRLSETLQNRVNLTAKVKSAIAYPVMMIIVAVAVVVFLLSFVIPSITQIFIEMNQALPWPTTLLISISAFLKKYLLLIAFVVCAVIFASAAWLRTKEGRFIADKAKLNFPLFGKLFLKLETARLARTMGILLTSGITILHALEIAKGVIQNTLIASALDSVKDMVSKGNNLAESMKETKLFPPIVYHIMATGQISANLEDGLTELADMYDREVETTAKTLTSLLEPAILLVMGAVIGFIVMAILLPIFEINQVL